MLALLLLLSGLACSSETFPDSCEGAWCGWTTSFESEHSALRSVQGVGETSSVTWRPFRNQHFEHGVELEWNGTGGNTSLEADFMETGTAGEEPHFWSFLYSAPVCPPTDPTYPNCRGTCAPGPPAFASDLLRGFFTGNVGVIVGSLAAIGVPSPIEFPPQPFTALAIAVRNDDRSLRVLSPLLMYPPLGFGEAAHVTLIATDNGDGTHDVDVSATYGGETRTTLAVVEDVDLGGPVRVAAYSASPSACTSFGKYPFGAGRTGLVASLQACK